jgi:hypothetical protein
MTIHFHGETTANADGSVTIDEKSSTATFHSNLR